MGSIESKFERSNYDKKDLSEIYYLKREIEALEEQIEILRAKTEKVTSTVSDMPSGSKTIDYKDILVDTAELLAERKKAIANVYLR